MLDSLKDSLSDSSQKKLDINRQLAACCLLPCAVCNHVEKETSERTIGGQDTECLGPQMTPWSGAAHFLPKLPANLDFYVRREMSFYFAEATIISTLLKQPSQFVN